MSNFVKGKFNIKPTVINLTKTFDTFEDAYTTVIKAIPELKAYCGDTAIEAAVLKAMMNSITNNIPSISNENYPNTLSFSINSKEVGFKTDSNIALGWRTVFDRKSASIKYKFRITFISVPAFRKVTIEEMKEDNWKEIDPTKQSRFWNDTEGRTFNKFEKQDEAEDK